MPALDTNHLGVDTTFKGFRKSGRRAFSPQNNVNYLYMLIIILKSVNHTGKQPGREKKETILRLGHIILFHNNKDFK